jgi:hypothetical protein
MEKILLVVDLPLCSTSLLLLTIWVKTRDNAGLVNIMHLSIK